jgi:hypothetical protein
MVNHSTHKESLNGNGQPAFFMGGMVDHHRLGFLYGWNG